MKIAYLHGLESSIDQKDPKIIFLNKNFDKAYTPSINYRDDNTFDKLYKDIKSLNPDLIVGSSMGGYVSYLIGSKLSIPVLLFNPAVINRTFNPVVDDSNLKKTKIEIRFGKSDSVVSGSEVIKYFKDNKVSFNHTRYDGGHRVPADVFINSIKDMLSIDEIYNKIEKIEYTLKHIKLFEQFITEKKPAGAPDFNKSDAPEAEGRFKDLGIKDLAAWLIKTRKGDVKKISGSLTQQVVFNRNDDPRYADKMEKVRKEVYKQLDRQDLIDNMEK